MARFAPVILPMMAIGLLALPLAACLPPVPAPPPVQAPQPDLSACDGAPALALLGQSVNLLPKTGNWDALRVIRPGMMVTMDYSATRLNVNVDTAGLILGASCG